jgi:hypothetical protein
MCRRIRKKHRLLPLASMAAVFLFIWSCDDTLDKLGFGRGDAG